MPKQSAKDELIARIDADMAQFERIDIYVKRVLEDGGEVLESVAADLKRLHEMRDYVTGGLTDAPPEKKRTRGKGTRGLPTTANVDGV